MQRLVAEESVRGRKEAETASIIITEENGEAEAEWTATVEEPPLGGVTEARTTAARTMDHNIETMCVAPASVVVSVARRSLFPLRTEEEKLVVHKPSQTLL